MKKSRFTDCQIMSVLKHSEPENQWLNSAANMT